MNTPVHYVNNADFLQAMKEYKAEIRAAEAQGLSKPSPSNYIGSCIIKIANHLSYSPKFVNYSYRDEMISDGIENCMMYLDNFDPDKGTNPFAYFTQIIYYAFIRRIQKEKKQTLVKGKLIMEMPFSVFELQEHDEDNSFSNTYIEFMQTHGIFTEIIEKEEKRRETRKVKRATLDDILGSDDIEYDV